MASRISAIRKMRANLKRGHTMPTPIMVQNIALRSGLNTGEIFYVIHELRDELSLAARSGRAVKINGFGIFTPTLRADGRINILFRADPEFLRDMNAGTLFTKIVNKASIGKSADELVALWNEMHPDDPVE